MNPSTPMAVRAAASPDSATKKLACTMLAVLAGLATFATDAATQTYSPVPRLLNDSNPQGIHATITPYGWIAGASGFIYSDRFQTSHGFSLSPGNLLNYLQFAAMLGGQIDADNWHGRVDLQYIGLSQSSAPLRLLLGGTAKLTSQTFIGTGTIGYTLVASNIWQFDPYIGARGWDLKTKLNIPAIASLPTEASVTNGWVDPIIGAQGQYRISSLMYALMGLDIGGFDVGSQFEGQTTASLQFRATKWLLGVVGFRYMYLDYVRDSHFTYQVNLYGPVLGLTFAF